MWLGDAYCWIYFFNVLSSSCVFKVKTVWAGTGLSADLLSYSLDAHSSISNLNGYRKYLFIQKIRPASLPCRHIQATSSMTQYISLPSRRFLLSTLILFIGLAVFLYDLQYMTETMTLLFSRLRSLLPCLIFCSWKAVTHYNVQMVIISLYKH